MPYLSISCLSYWLRALFWAYILLLGNTICVYAQASNNYTTANGLPSNEVYSIFQDNNGYLWFGTDHGLVKYNGYNFTTYTTNDGLTDNTIFTIKQDNQGLIWFLSLSGGVIYYDGNGFHPHPQNDSIKKLCNLRLPTSFSILDNKEIWLGFNEIGIYQFTESSVNGYLPKNETSRETIHVLYLGCREKVYASFKDTEPIWPDKLKKDVGIFLAGNSGVARHNFIFHELDSAHIILASLQQMVVFNREQQAIAQYKWGGKMGISNLKTLDDGTTWCTIIGNATYQITFTDNRIAFIDSITISHSPSDILIDNQGNCWITSLDKGIYMMPNKNVKHLLSAGLPVTEPISKLLSTGGKLYVGLPEGSVLSVDSGMNVTTRIGNSTATTSDMILVGGNIITNLDYTKTLRYLGPSPEGMPYVSVLLQLDNGNILSGGENGFLITTSNKVLFRSPTIGFHERVTTFTQLKANQYAIGTTTGLYYYNPTTQHLVKDTVLGEVRISSCHYLNDSSFLVTTKGKGLVLFKDNTHYVIDQRHGLVSNIVEDCFSQNDSVLWVATFKGLTKVRYRISNGQLHTQMAYYSKEDGICSDEINSIIGYNGFIWLATNNGLCYFRPEELVDDTTQVNLTFGSVYVNGGLRSMDSMKLQHDQNNILIEFNGIYYPAEGNMRYKVRLNKGKWQYVTQNSVQYFNLPPDQYLLEIAAEDKYGKYVSAVKSLGFTIYPKFTDTFGFKCLIGAIVLAIAFLLVYLYVSYQRIKVRIELRYLQAELKALNYQINPHFIFNTLNSIQHYILQKDNKYAVELLGSFSSLIRKIITNARQPYISIIEEVECLKEYLDLEKVRLDGQIDYEIIINSDIDIQKKVLLPMVIQPIVENSIWHGIIPGLKKGKIIITFKKTNNNITCTVEDDGIGIHHKTNNDNKKKNNLSLAMDNVRERLKIIGELHHSMGSFTVTDKKTLGGTESGTIVSITFPTLNTTNEKHSSSNN